MDPVGVEGQQASTNGMVALQVTREAVARVNRLGQVTKLLQCMSGNALCRRLDEQLTTAAASSLVFVLFDYFAQDLLQLRIHLYVLDLAEKAAQILVGVVLVEDVGGLEGHGDRIRRDRIRVVLVGALDELVHEELLLLLRQDLAVRHEVCRRELIERRGAIVCTWLGGVRIGEHNRR